MLFKGQLNILLLCVPISIILNSVSATPGLIFLFSLLGIAPLAERLGYVTEQLAMHTNETVGGLLNVTFGNATELIVAVAALYNGLNRVVQLTLLGSVLSNLLLVLGSALLLGGIYNSPMQHFGRLSADVNIPLLFVASASMVFPTALANSSDTTADGILAASRCASIVLFLLYCVFLLFQVTLCLSKLAVMKITFEYYSTCFNLSSAQLRTHYSMFSDEDGETFAPGTDRENFTFSPRSANDGDATYTTTNTHTHTPATRSECDDHNHTHTNAHIHDHDEVIIRLEANSETDIHEGDTHTIGNNADDAEEDILGVPFSLLWLTIITVFISLLSDSLVTTIEATATKAGVSNVFLAAIVVPIVGNAAEHSSAIVFGVRNRLNLALGIAIGSGTQIGLFLFPTIVLVGWAANIPIGLDLKPFEAVCLITAVILVAYIIKNRRSTWLDGVVLIGAYVIVCGGFWTHSNESDLST